MKVEERAIWTRAPIHILEPGDVLETDGATLVPQTGQEDDEVSCKLKPQCGQVRAVAIRPDYSSLAVGLTVYEGNGG